jgi:hypothetical protein
MSSSFTDNVRRLLKGQKPLPSLERIKFLIGNWRVHRLPVRIPESEEYNLSDAYANAVRGNLLRIDEIPEEYITPELLRDVLSVCGRMLKYVRRRFITRELCIIALTNDGTALEYVPLTEYIPRTGPVIRGNAPERVPAEFIDKELCDIAMIQNPDALRYVVRKFINRDYCDRAVVHNGNNLKFVPYEFITQEMCDRAVRKSGLALRFVPVEFLSYILCDLAVYEDPNALPFVPYELMTEKMCFDAVLRNVRLLEHVPSKYKTLLFLAGAVLRDPQALSYIEDENISKALTKLAGKIEISRRISLVEFYSVSQVTS